MKKYAFSNYRKGKPIGKHAGGGVSRFNSRYICRMKYRRLTNEELQELEKDFVRFLAANTITAEDWVRLKDKEPGKAEELIGVFSDIVFEKSLANAEYLEFKTPKDVKTFHFRMDRVVMNGLKVEGESRLDLTGSASVAEMVEEARRSDARLALYTAEKAYRKDREQEMFALLESGALISRDGLLFKTLEELKTNP